MDKLTPGQAAADFAAKHIGSWRFIIVFNLMIAVWIISNVVAGPHAIDAFPFILLNLMLSWLAGVQAPLIMISQNRQEEVQKATVESIAAIGRATYEVAEATRALLAEHTEILHGLSEQRRRSTDHV